MSSEDQTAEAELRYNPDIPHGARIWNYWVGGKDNFPADREVAEAAIRAYPGIVAIARESRKALVRVVRFLTEEAGIRQFLDIGTGLPTENNTHEVAQGIAPESRIVYVDNDPLVLLHARALLTSTPRGATAYLEADVREPEEILEQAAATLDFDKPIGLILFGVLGAAVKETDEARGIVQALLARMAPGSYIAINDSVHGEADKAADAVAEGGYEYTVRYYEEIAGFFDGTELIEPGLVPNALWRPDGPDGELLPSHCGVGRKP
ncbi:SAM-dependent methyltransferase [Frankia sp. CNm7]|uniref:SAM-dependent methyltransferase n=1 Tax=Frankia nepalensis TaxID=1836974 RepID=A0A937RKC1_9ACTN|nr:SAM-dependent methyltransferase [Frankia nepalensis]MBL7502574.1 SAM-dependent methyltransferase [Frankia nepalensis]MBL7515480.1 SAM-dependent methyltransferase [Frankia nepalensis]MBL7517667.1 SAM-dependent methyltransferase [Frankia nepalensis]MBL7631747.1 SAM-dependent methyltransferase [Frankia nepalensis]